MMARQRASNGTTKIVQVFKDFTGGLNLSTARQDLQMNETPSCLDVDFDNRGGVVCRRGIASVTTAATMGTTATSGYLVGQLSLGTDLVWGISSAGKIWTWDGSTVVENATVTTSNMTTESVRGATWGQVGATAARLFLANTYLTGTLTMRTWDGTAAAPTTLTNTANNVYTAPAGGNAPLAKLICDHGGYMWWADTLEGGIRFRSRLRFSHPLQPADFAAADYFDIEPDDQTDQITALVRFRGQLFVFKKKAVYAVYGTTRDDFVVQRIAATAGTVSQDSVAVSQDSMYWWSPDGDVFKYNGTVITSIATKINILARNGTMNAGDDHRLAWAGDRLYVSFLNVDSTRSTYVYMPMVGRSGSWTKYSYQWTSMVWWRRNVGSTSVITRILGQAGVSDLNIATQKADYNGTSTTPIAAQYTTAWFQADNPALLKKWHRVTASVAADDPATLNLTVYQDFDESTIVKQLSNPINAATGSLVWGAATGNWGGVGLYWQGNNPVYTYARFPASGRSHSIQYKFNVTDHLGGWSLDSFAIPFIEKAFK